MRLGVLGPLEARTADGELIVRGRRDRACLSALALHRGKAISVDTLVDAVWPTDPPASGRKAVQNAVSRLREVLGSTSVEFSPSGYRLQPGIEIDVDDVERTVRDVAATPAQLQAALGSFRGRPFDDLEGWPPADIEAFRLGLLRADIEERLAEAQIADGQWVAAAVELDGMVEREPFREHRWVLFMTALRLAGRRAESLRAFARARRHLLDGVGIEPGPELAGLARNILAELAESTVVEPLQRPSFVGRSAELREMTGRWERARAGDRGLVIVAGPPGIGKTTLATSVLAGAAASGARTAVARAEPGGAVPFAPVSQVVRELIGTESAVDELMASEDPFTQLGRRTSGPAASTALVARAVVNRLAAIADDDGVAVVLDDLHCATADTIELLRCMWETTSLRRTFIAVTYRNTELAADHPLRAWINHIVEADPGALITLEGLTTDDFVELFDAEAGTTLHTDTAGNPMLAMELWRAGADTRDVAIPPTIVLLIGARIDRLASAATRFVEVAAVCGLSFDPVVVATATELDAASLGAALDQLTAAGLIDMSALAAARFVHPLMQRAVLARLPPSGLLDAHRRLWAAYEEMGTGTNAAKAIHALASASDSERRSGAVALTLAAGNDAYRQSAFEEAATWYERGLEAHRTADFARYELLVGKGRALAELATTAFREPLVEAADIAAGLGDDMREGDALLLMNRVFTSATMIPDADLVARVATLRTRVAARADLAARLAACEAAEGLFLLDTDSRLATEREALRLARATSHADTLCYVLIRRITNGFDIANAHERVALLAEFNGLAQSYATLTERSCAKLVEITTQVELVRLDDAERTMGQLQAETADVHDRYIKTMVRIPEATLLMAHGELAAVEALADIIERDAPDVGVTVAAIRGECHRQRGDWQELLSLRVPPSAASLPTYLLAIADARAHLGSPDHGLELMTGPLLNDLIAMRPSMLRGVCWFAAARLAVTVNCRDPRLDALLDRIRPYTGRIATVSMSTIEGPADHTIGLLAAQLGHRSEADIRLRRALEIAEQLGNDLWTAHAMAALAALRDDDAGTTTARTMAARAGINDLSGNFIPAQRPTLTP